MTLRLINRGSLVFFETHWVTLSFVNTEV